MTLLDPDSRDLFTDLLRPPPGMRLDVGVGATYSLSLDTLLSVPLHLLLYSGEQEEEELLTSGIAVLDALRKVSGRLRVYCQRGRIQEPSKARTLFSLLERVAVEVESPGESGSFHPKVWVLRFRNDDEDRTVLRVLVLSRNVTHDLSWDVVLQLEGTPGETAVEGNHELADLIATLGRLGEGGGPDLPGPDHDLLADDVLRTRWDLPEGFDRVRFHVAGMDGRGWLPARSERLAVVSPFCRDSALEALIGTTGELTALVSRPEELQELSQATLEHARLVYVLDEMAETEDGEDGPPDTRGLHAKVYVAEQKGRTHLYLGSANATNAALLGGRNVEVMAELVGDTDRVGGVDALLSGDGLGAMLQAWRRSDKDIGPDQELREAEHRLEEARRTLAAAGLSLNCEEEADRWRLTLVTPRPVGLKGIKRLRAWPVTVDRSRALDADPLRLGNSVELPISALASLTGLVAFDMEAEDVELSSSFVLNLAVAGLPREERDAAVIRGIVRDEDSFLRYLLLLLGEIDEAELLTGNGGLWEWTDGRWSGAVEDLPLLEEMTRAYCRDPERLEQVRDLLRDLEEVGGRDGDHREVIPPDFRELWSVFESAMLEKAE